MKINKFFQSKTNKISHLLLGCIFFTLSFILASCQKENTVSLGEENLSQVKSRSILALGDSLTAGYNLPPEDAYPAQLELILQSSYKDIRVENAGKSGDTSEQLLDRIDFSLEGSDFDLVILNIGGNDGLQGKSLEELERNLRTSIEKIQSKKIPILLCGMQIPTNLGGDYTKNFQAIYSKLAKEYNLLFYPFFLKDVALEKNLNLPDGIHPNAAGYKIIAEHIASFLKETPESPFYQK